MCHEKENRKLAQELRAAERKKKAFLRRLKRILTVVIPLLAVLILVSVIVWDSVSSKEEETASNSAAEEQTSGTDVTADSASYSTDASLTVQNGDTVNIDYVGTVGGVEFDGGSTNGAGTDLTIGSGLYIDDFEEQLIGLSSRRYRGGKCHLSWKIIMQQIWLAKTRYSRL